ncbi:hypothetical protein [Methanothrix soehngenii]|uniref:hypothetical protein n=1 Tax=Methanothrix soehngenii TaxID=2223 RepID=UPI00300CCAC7
MERRVAGGGGSARSAAAAAARPARPARSPPEAYVARYLDALPSTRGARADAAAGTRQPPLSASGRRRSAAAVAAELYRAGVLCGLAEARAEFVRRIDVAERDLQRENGLRERERRDMQREYERRSSCRWSRHASASPRSSRRRAGG